MPHIKGMIEFDCDFDALTEDLKRNGYIKVVRCVDCRWWSGKNGGFCDILALNIPDEEFFCAWGEQRRVTDGNDQ